MIIIHLYEKVNYNDPQKPLQLLVAIVLLAHRVYFTYRVSENFLLRFLLLNFLAISFFFSVFIRKDLNEDLKMWSS